MNFELQKTSELLSHLPVHVEWHSAGIDRSNVSGKQYDVDHFTVIFDGQGEELFHYNLDPPAIVDGSIRHAEDENGVFKYVDTDQLEVGPEFRRQNLGERISKAIAVIAEQQGCSKITAQLSHPASLKIMRNIYGDERIHFTKKDDDGNIVPLEITADEALTRIQSEREHVLEHGVVVKSGTGESRHEPKTDDEIIPGTIKGVTAWVNIEGFDTSSFDTPIQSGALPGTSEPFDY